MTANHLSLKSRLVLGRLTLPWAGPLLGSSILSFVSRPSPVVLLHLLRSSFCSCAPLGWYLPLFMLLPYFSTNQSSVCQFLVGISSFQELPTCFECTPEAASCSPLLSLLQPENFHVFLTKERSGLQNVALASLLALPPLCPPPSYQQSSNTSGSGPILILFIYLQGFL